MFMGNIHGHRINMDMLKPKGSGYVAVARPRFPAGQRRLGAVHQPALRAGRQRLHDRLVRQAGVPHRRRRHLGPHQRPDLQDLLSRTKPVTGVDLPRKQRRGTGAIATERERLVSCATPAGLAGTGGRQDARSTTVHERAGKIAFEHQGRLATAARSLGLARDGGLNDATCCRRRWRTTSPHVRAWAIQLALEGGKAKPDLMAPGCEWPSNDPSPVVRLYLASGLQRLPADSAGTS